jgi:hypothetical protein
MLLRTSRFSQKEIDRVSKTGTVPLGMVYIIITAI